MSDTPFRLGWEEWIALPDLGLPALKVKVDTGAKTSALHAYDIEPFGPAKAPKVRFMMHPIPSRPDLAVTCTAAITDRREVTSSNGETELRYVVETPMSVGGRTWPVELTLTDRGGMAYRMLLGRQAFPDDVVVVPGDSFCQPQLGYDAYGPDALETPETGRALRVAVLSETAGPAVRRILEEGAARGHTIRHVDPRRCYMTLDTLAPEIHCDGRRLRRYDAVVPWLGAEPHAFALSVLRQFEATGAWTANLTAGLETACDRLRLHQLLARRRIALPATVLAAGPVDPSDPVALAGAPPLLLRPAARAGGPGAVAPSDEAANAASEALAGYGDGFLLQSTDGSDDVRCLVIGASVTGAIRKTAARTGGRASRPPLARMARVRLTRPERDMALRAARAVGLGLAAITLRRGADGPRFLDVDVVPPLDEIETVAGKSPFATLFDLVERRAAPAPPKRRKTKRSAV